MYFFSIGAQGHWPGIILAGEQRFADRVQAGNKLARVAENFQHAGADPGHDMHIGHDIRRVGNLDADFGDRGAHRAHGKRNHIQDATSHAARIELVTVRFFSSTGSIQLLVGPASSLDLGGNEGAVFNAGYIGRIRSKQI